MNMNKIRTEGAMIKHTVGKIFDGFEVSYTLFTETFGSAEVYSITAEGNGETATARKITSDKGKAIFIFDMLCGGKVTPCCLLEVTEDLIESLP